MFWKSLCYLFLLVKLVDANSRLELVQTLFIHPNKYSVPSYLVVNDSVENEYNVAESMTNEEKLKVYQLGVRLRKRYENFIGDIYTPKVSRTRTTEDDVSKMAGELIDAGLWPPSDTQKWSNDLLWQPVPIDFVSSDVDLIMKGRLCPKFKEMTKMVRNNAKIVQMEEKHQELYAWVGKETGLKITNSGDIAEVYKTLKSLASRNFTLPDWTIGIFPDGEMLDVIYLEDWILSRTNIQKKLNGGYLIQEVLLNAAVYADGLLDSERKITLYSGDGQLLIGVLDALGAWSPHVPNIGEAVIFEFWYNEDKHSYEMKIFHHPGKDDETVNPLKISGYRAGDDSTGYNFESLIIMLANILPGYDDNICGKPSTTIDLIYYEEETWLEIITLNHAPRSTCGVLLISCIFMLNELLRN